MVWVDFSPQMGREQAGRRPAVVVGSSVGVKISERHGLVTVLPCTGTDRGWAWQPRISLKGRPCVVMCEQIKSVSVDRVVGRHEAQLTDEEIADIRAALRRLLGL